MTFLDRQETWDAIRAFIPDPELGQRLLNRLHKIATLAPEASELGLREAVEHALEFVAYDVPDNPADPMAALRHARKLARAALEARILAPAASEIDVERLARAMHFEETHTRIDHPWIAAEYDRLATPPDPPT